MKQHFLNGLECEESTDLGNSSGKFQLLSPIRTVVEEESKLDKIFVSDWPTGKADDSEEIPVEQVETETSQND